MTIFRDYAPLYWEAGINVIPLRSNSKSPSQSNWPRWGIEAIPEQVKQSWLTTCSDGNIGVPAGPASDLCFVDIDTYDPQLLAMVENALPKSPWRRIGQKGCVLAFKWNGARSFKIKTQEKVAPGTKGLGVEFFGSSGQIVLPPSVHPDTQKPYVASSNLWEVKSLLPELTPEIETVLRGLLRNNNLRLEATGMSRLIDKTSKGSRDTMMIKHAGTLAYEIIRGTTTLKEALDHLDDWASNMAEGVDGDDVDISKGRTRIVEFLVRSVSDRKVALPKGWDEGLDEELRQALNLSAITEDDVSLDADEIQRRLFEDLQKIDDLKQPNAYKVRAVDEALRRIARSQSISELEVDALLQTISNNTGKLMKMPALRKGLRRHQTTGIEGSSHSEIAEAILKDFADLELRFEFETLWEWQGSHWAKKDKQEVLKHLIQHYGHLPAAKRASDHGGIYKTLCSLVARPLQTTHVPGINFANGYLTTDLRLIPHDRNFGMTYEMPYDYKPELHNKATRFLSFLDQSWSGDSEMIALMQEAVAVTLFGLAPKYEKAFLLYGVPHSGKSVLLDIVSALVPEIGRATIPPHRFHEKFLVTELQGKIMNFAGELPETKDIQSSSFKTIISGQPTAGERKNRDPFMFRPVRCTMVASNNLPKTKDVSAGFLRRWMIIPFKKAVPETEKNVNLADEIICSEREAIVAWAVEGITRVLQQNHLTMPKTSMAFLEDMGSTINPIRTWFRERMAPSAGTTVDEEVAFNDYGHYCLLKGYRKLDRAMFRITMSELAAAGTFDCNRSGAGVQSYDGIKLLQLRS